MTAQYSAAIEAPHCWQWGVLLPEDVLLFRDGRPFNAGADFRAEGVFPPLPSPVAGAIRTGLLRPLLAAQGYSFADFAEGNAGATNAAWGDANTLGKLQLAGPFICRIAYREREIASATSLFVAPADLVGARVPRFASPPPDLARNALFGTEIPGVIAVAESAKPGNQDLAEPSDWVDEAELLAYLTGAGTVVRLTTKQVPFTLEEQVGIERGDKRTATAGMFYTAQVHRLWEQSTAAFGLLVGGVLPTGCFEPGYLHLGGERRCAYLHPLSALVPRFIQEEIRTRIAQAVHQQGGRFRVYLATPGVFGNAPHAGTVPRVLAEGDLAGVRFQYVGASCGKPVAVGGWDLAANLPRPARRAVPAGSVFYGQLTAPTLENAQQLVALLHGTTALQHAEGDGAFGEEAKWRARMGFGYTLIGCWQAWDGSAGATDTDD